MRVVLIIPPNASNYCANAECGNHELIVHIVNNNVINVNLGYNGIFVNNNRVCDIDGQRLAILCYHLYEDFECFTLEGVDINLEYIDPDDLSRGWQQISPGIVAANAAFGGFYAMIRLFGQCDAQELDELERRIFG